MLYNNIFSCTVSNGFSSPFFFNLHRGVRQGCPLSGMIFGAECTIGMDWGLTALKHYGNMALWHYGTMAIWQ